MRPIRLEMKAFGPYADVQVLDFRELRGHSLLLVHGPTGSGKTSIFDAICFALYGTDSCHKRDGKSMRSHHADPQQLTEVTFDFALGSEVYRVRRSPDQDRPKLRGTGSAVMKSEAALWRRTGLQNDAEEGTPLATHPGRVSEEVVQLLGFLAEQFRQVIMLPQGEFQQLLLADSGKRGQILEVLFQVEQYRVVEEALKAKAKELERQAGELRAKQGSLLETSHQPDLRAVEENLRLLEDTFAEVLLALERAQQARMKAEAARHLGEQDAAKLLDAREAGALLAELDRKRAHFQDLDQQLRRAESAAALASLEQSMSARIQEHERALRAESEAVRKHALATQRLEAAEAAHAREQAREPERRALTEELLRLERIADEVEKIGALREEQTGAAEALASSEQACVLLIQKREAISEKLAVLQPARDAEQAVAQGLERYREQRDAAERKLKLKKNLEAMQVTVVTLEKQCEATAAKAANAERAVERAREEADRMHSGFLESQASALAAILRPGKQCPVCGSKEHPLPALSLSLAPTTEEMKRQRTVVAKAEKACDEAKSDEQAFRAELDRQFAYDFAVREALGPAASQSLESLESEWKLAAKMAIDSERAAKELEALDRQLAALLHADQSLCEQLEVSQQQQRTASDALQRITAVLTDREGRVPEALRSKLRLEAAQSAAARLQDATEKAWSTAQAERLAAGESFAKCSADRESTRDQAERAAASAEQARQQFSEQLIALQFRDHEEYLQARRSPEQRREWKDAIQSFQTNMSIAVDRAERARQAAEGLSEPNLDRLRETAVGCTIEVERLLEKKASTGQQREHLAHIHRQLIEVERELQEIEANYQIYGQLSLVASGRNELGITFQRFVQATLLDDVLSAATQRLEKMTRQRYYLQRSQIRTDKRTSGGLDLEVYDSYTGKTRPASTLSGGETFLASLALALGLADVVQRHAGGIHLEAMFIDEGFGTLDPDALELAIECLVQLQSGGRLVGIISHVPELREQIKARLEVTPQPRGSKARFVIG